MTTEIQRLPGAFNLAGDWPRVRLGNLDAGMLAHWVGDDAVPTSLESMTTLATGSSMVMPWSSRTGKHPITGPVGTKALTNVVQMASRFNNHKYCSITGTQAVQTDVFTSPYTGPMTFAGYMMFASGTTTSNMWVLNTSGAGSHYAGLQLNYSSNTFGMGAYAQGTGAPDGVFELSAPLTVNVYHPFIACWNGANSYIRWNDTVTTGSIANNPTINALRLGQNSGGTQIGMSGRIAEMRVYNRALTLDEADMAAEALRKLYG